MRRALVALALGLMIGISVPVMADHITEPTTPITAVRMALYEYPDANTVLSACNGSETVTFQHLRIETFVTAAGVKGNGNPSEHFDERLRLAVVTNFGQQNEAVTYEWDVMWRHSNIPPHGFGAARDGWESSQNVQRLSAYAPGTVLRVIDRVTGLESGGFFEVACTFRVG